MISLASGPGYGRVVGADQAGHLASAEHPWRGEQVRHRERLLRARRAGADRSGRCAAPRSPARSRPHPHRPRAGGIRPPAACAAAWCGSPTAGPRRRRCRCRCPAFPTVCPRCRVSSSSRVSELPPRNGSSSSGTSSRNSVDPMRSSLAWSVDCLARPGPGPVEAASTGRALRSARAWCRSCRGSSFHRPRPPTRSALIRS